MDGGFPWRLLYTQVLETDHAHQDVRPLLERWVREHPSLVAEALEAGQPGAHLRLLGTPRPDSYTTSQRLYALSRVLDLLLLNHQPAPHSPSTARYDDPRFAGRDALPVLAAAIGAEPVGARAFHPFFHEVVEVVPADDPDEPPTVLEERWPGYLLGSMVLLRAGVAVRAGSHHLVRGVADRSAIYWTFRRRARPAHDLSLGWGSNSQWTTPFRRDYVVDGVLHYNVDAAVAGRSDLADDELDAAAVRELVRHRCSTVVDHGDDLFPYDDHHVEPAP